MHCLGRSDIITKFFKIKCLGGIVCQLPSTEMYGMELSKPFLN